MRILHVTDSYLPTIGGAERAVQGLARQRVAEGHQPLILTGLHPDAPPDEILSGIPIMRRPMLTQRIPGALANPNRPFHATLLDPIFMRAVREALERHAPDVIHCHGWSRFSVLPVARRYQIPVVGTAHDFGFACAVKHGTMPDNSACSGPALGKCVRHAAQHYGLKGVPIALGLRSMAGQQRSMRITGISEPIRHFGDETPYAPGRMIPLPSFIPDEALDLSTAIVPEWVPQDDYLMFVGALTELKGINVLLESHKILREERGLDIPLLLVGTWQPDTPTLDAPNVTMREDVPHREVMGAWCRATVGVVPSVLPEGFGQVVVEAMAAGTPVIGTNHGGIPEIVTHDVDGLLVPPRDSIALADAVERLWRDSSLRERLATAGRQRARDFTVSEVAPRFLEIYQEAIRQYRGH